MLFACSYALCAWALGYQWNIMWLDTFALLPMVMLGMISLLQMLAAILNTTLTVAKASVDGGGSETVTDRVFLLSRTSTVAPAAVAVRRSTSPEKTGQPVGPGGLQKGQGCRPVEWDIDGDHRRQAPEGRQTETPEPPPSG